VSRFLLLAGVFFAVGVVILATAALVLGVIF
jgi:hypothetical protein